MYFSVDVESDGPVPGLHSMLSIGISALHPETLEECAHFYQTVKRLGETNQDLDTMKWWSGFPEQYKAATLDPADPLWVMQELDEWVGAQRKRFDDPTPIFVAYPASFDFMFYAYYAHRFVGRSAFGFVALDMGSLAMGFNGGAYDDQTKKKWPENWVEPKDRVALHHALDDARQQADIFRRMMKTIRRPLKSWWCGWTIPPHLENPNGEPLWPYGMTGSCTGEDISGGYTIWCGRVDAPSAIAAKEIIRSAYGDSRNRICWRWEPRIMTAEEISEYQVTPRRIP